jgi:hypothetical protein
MSRVEIPAPGDLVMDPAGNVRVGEAVTLTLANTATAATHYSALSAGTSTTGGLVTGSDGTIVDGSGNRRYIDEGEYDLTIVAITRRIEAGNGSRRQVIDASKAPYYVTGGLSTDQTTVVNQAITDAAALNSANGTEVQFPAGVIKITTLLWRGDIALRGAGLNSTQFDQISGTADVIARPADTSVAGQRLEMSHMTLTSFNNQASNTGGLDLFRLTKSVLTRVKVSYFKNYGIRTKGGADPLTGDAMRNEFHSCEIANGQANSYAYLGTNGSDVGGATNGGGHPDGTMFYGGLITGSSMLAAWRVDAPPSNGALVYAQDCLIVFGTQVQSVPVIFDLQGGWGHRFIGCRWENTDGVMSMTAGAGSVLHPVWDIGLIGCSLLLAGNIATITDTNSAIWHIGTLDGSSHVHMHAPQGLKFSRLSAPWDNDSLYRDTGDRPSWYGHDGNVYKVGLSRVGTTITAASYTQLVLDSVIPVDTTANNVTVTLLAANTQSGNRIIIKRISAGANTLTIDPNGAETIDGAATLSLPTQWNCATLVSNGTNWLRLD